MPNPPATFRSSGRRRLIAALRCDVRLQYRQGFYWAAAFVAVVLIALLRLAPDDILRWLLPVLVIGNVITNTFYFVGGLVLLEKREGTLEALVVTPLRSWEYLAAKLISLTVLSLVENVTISVIAFGPDLGWLAIVAGLGLASALFTCCGFLVVARYDSINEYLMPSILYTALLGLPLVTYFGVWDGPWVLAHPLQPAIELLRAAYREPPGPAGVAAPVYGLALGAGWAALAFWLSERAFLRFIIAREGAPRA